MKRLFCIALFTAGNALAQSYPARPVSFIVPFAPGAVPQDKGVRIE